MTSNIYFPYNARRVFTAAKWAVQRAGLFNRINTDERLLRVTASHGFPIVGWISVAVYGYSTTLFSGCAYLEVLAAMHQKGRVKERFDAGNVVSIFNNKRIE